MVRRLPVCDVRQEPQLTRALDRGRELGLVPATCTGHARGANLSLVTDRPAQRGEVLVIDDVDLLPAERAGLEAPATGAALTAGAALAVPCWCSTTLLRHLCSCVLATPGSEGNVVVRSPGGHRRLREVRCVRGNIALRREATAVLATLTGAKELDGIGNDIYRLPVLAAFLVLPLAPLEPPVDRDRASLREVLGAVLALGTPDGDVEVVGLVDPFARRLVLAPRVARDPQAAYSHAARKVPELRVAGQVPREDDPVDVGACHGAETPPTPCAVDREYIRVRKRRARIPRKFAKSAGYLTKALRGRSPACPFGS